MTNGLHSCQKANTLLPEPSAHLAIGCILNVRIHPPIPNPNPLQILCIHRVALHNDLSCGRHIVTSCGIAWHCVCNRRYRHANTIRYAVRDTEKLLFLCTVFGNTETERITVTKQCRYDLKILHYHLCVSNQHSVAGKWYRNNTQLEEK